MRKYIILFLISLVIFLFHFYKTKHGIYGDGNGYFALAHTLFFQHNLNFKPIYEHLSHFQGASYIFSRVFWDTKITSTGVLDCPWLIGTSLFWIPSFLIVWVINLIFNLHLSIFHPLFEVGCGISGTILILSGLFFIEKYIKTFVDKSTSSWVIISLYFSTQLFYYAGLEPALSHQVAFFLVSFFLYISKRKKGTLPVMLSSLIFGLLMITRMGDGVVLFPFIMHQFYIWFKKRKITKFLLFILFFLLGITPQLFLQKAMYGSFTTNPYLHGSKGSFSILTPLSFWNQLFSFRGGFLLWSPLFIFAFVGLYLMLAKKKFKLISIFSLAGIMIFIIVISSWQNIVPAGFGNRFFISSIPLYAIGLAYYFSRHKDHMVLLFCISGLWNIMLLILFYI